jgi:KaiC/GvpD/RAD55 family RecA-like ATPase
MSNGPIQNIPDEIISFFRENVGDMILVKGPPGSGKTLFSLECMKALCQRKKGITIFPRMDREQLLSEFNWLSDDFSKGNLMAFHGNTKMADPNWFKREFELLSSKIEGEPIGFMLFDTIDAITEEYENPERKMKELMSLVQSSNVSAIMVMENEGTTYLDHLAGAIVHLSVQELDNRKFRALNIEKMRGVEIRNHNYLFTLHNGTFKAFKPYSLSKPKTVKWVSVDDTSTHFSTGLKDMDDILSGGYARGSYNILDVDDNISSSEYLLLLRPILLNFLSHGLGVLMIPPAGEHPESLREDIKNYLSEDELKEKLYFLDYFSGTSNREYIIPMGAQKKEGVPHRGHEIVSNLRGKENRPYLDFVGLDTMEYLNGENLTLRHLLTGISNCKVAKTLGIGIAKPGLKIGQGIKNMADVYLRMVKIHSIPCFYGIKPETGIYAILPNKEFGFPNLELVPLT